MPNPRKPTDFDQVLNDAAEAVADQVKRASNLKIRFRRQVAERMKPLEAPKPDDDDEEEGTDEEEED